MKRFDIVCGDGGRYVDESPDGEWVRAEDALAMERRALEAEVLLRRCEPWLQMAQEAVTAEPFEYALDSEEDCLSLRAEVAKAVRR